jgi:hypothetical protein
VLIVVLMCVGFLSVGGLHLRMIKCPLIPASFVSTASNHTTTLMARRLATLRLIHFMVELLSSDKALGNILNSHCCEF